MKIAVASEGKQVSGHFGHCESFIIYDISDNKVTGKVVVPNPGHKPGYLPVFLKEKGANVVIAGSMGETAQQLFDKDGVKAVLGAEGESDEVVQKYLNGQLESTGRVCSGHKHEGHCHD